MSTMTKKGPVYDPGLCRCCGLLKKCRLLNIEYESFGNKEVYADMMMDCFGLLLSHLDGKPTERLICAACVIRLREAHNFRRQVMQSEELFIQMKMFPTTEDVKPNCISMLDGSKVEVDIVKSEPVDNDSDGDMPAADAVMDSCADEPAKPESKTFESSVDDKPIKQRIQRQLKPKPRPNPKYSTLKHPLVKKPGNLMTAAKIPMSKLQQLMRERDPSYMSETNLVTIVEYSYVTPFKCRHNHLICYYCQESFQDPSLLRQHTLEDHHPKRFKVHEHSKMLKVDLTRIDCRLCGTKIDDIEVFKRHITTIHKKQFYMNYREPILPFKLTKEESKCALCDAAFPYFHALNKHMNEHFSNYVCETCGLGFVDKGRFVMHQHRHVEGDFPCEMCGKIFKAAYNRDLHVDRVHKKRGRVCCPKCGIGLMSYGQKMKHLIDVHGEEPMSFPCDFCDKVYETRRMWTIHRRKQHLKDYRYECHYCSQKFFTRFSLTNHMPTHTGERNFKCKVCEKSYPRLKTLKDHLRIHTNDRRYRCEVCGQAFIQNCSLKGHMKSQHPELHLNQEMSKF